MRDWEGGFPGCLGGWEKKIHADTAHANTNLCNHAYSLPYALKILFNFCTLSEYRNFSTKNFLNYGSSSSSDKSMEQDAHDHSIPKRGAPVGRGSVHALLLYHTPKHPWHQTTFPPHQASRWRGENLAKQHRMDDTGASLKFETDISHRSPTGTGGRTTLQPDPFIPGQTDPMKGNGAAIVQLRGNCE